MFIGRQARERSLDNVWWFFGGFFLVGWLYFFKRDFGFLLKEQATSYVLQVSKVPVGREHQKLLV